MVKRYSAQVRTNENCDFIPIKSVGPFLPTAKPSGLRKAGVVIVVLGGLV